MGDLEAELAAARALDVAELADAIESIGFECTRCGACCRGEAGEHTATVFPDEVRAIAARSGAHGWRDVARPMPFGLSPGPEGEPTGETFEWALQTDACGDCVFYREDGPHDSAAGEPGGTCAVYADRPLICRTYPFSVGLGGVEPAGDVVDSAGPVRAHECEGLGRDIDRADAEALARTLKERTVREVEELRAVRDAHEPADPPAGSVVVHDSEGAKRPDGSAYQ